MFAISPCSLPLHPMHNHSHHVMISRANKVVFSDVYGFSDAAAKTPLQPDALFRWASMTKPVTCVAAMICYERGCFQLDDVLSKFLPEWEDTPVLAGGDADAPQLEPQASPITIKMLLTHTSGITSLGLVQSEAARMMSRGMKQRVEEHGGPPGDLKEQCEFLASSPLVAQPGTLWHYGAGLTVLGRCIEVWSGQTFDVFLQQNLFAPLGSESIAPCRNTRESDRTVLSLTVSQRAPATQYARHPLCCL